MPGLPVCHQLLEFTQTHVHWVGDAIQPSHPLSSPSSPAFNIYQHQDLFQWVSSLHQVAKALEFQLQHQSFQWIFRMDWVDLLAVQGTLKSLLQHPHYMWILVSLKLFPLYYLRFTVMTSTGLGIFFSAQDPEVQRGKLTPLKLWLGWRWRGGRDLHWGVTPSWCCWPWGCYKDVFPVSVSISCLASQLWWTRTDGDDHLKEPLVLKKIWSKTGERCPRHEGGS